MATKIFIQSVEDSDVFKIKQSDTSNQFETYAKIYQIFKVGTINQKPALIIRHANYGEILAQGFTLDEIDVDGETSFANFEELSALLAPILFKKGGGSGQGGGATYTFTPPLINNAGNVVIQNASSSNRGTMSSSDFNKLSEFLSASNYALKTEVTALDTSLKSWVENKGYATVTGVANLYYNKTEIDGKLFSVYKPKGSVANYSALIALTSKDYGDVYNLLDTGDNYVWIKDFISPGNDGWDKLSGVVDLSVYHTITQYQSWVTSQGYITSSSLTKANVGLGNVDNTSDIDKPISIATNTELSKKLDKTTASSQTVTGPVTFSSTLNIPKIVLPTQTSNTTINAIYSSGSRITYNGPGGTPQDLAFLSDLLEHKIIGKRIEATVSSGNYTIDLNTGSHFSIVLTAAATLSVINIGAADETRSFTMTITGAFLETLPSGWVRDTYSDVTPNLSKTREYNVVIKRGGVSPLVRFNMINI